MEKSDLIRDIATIDSLLGRCVNPALTRDDHDSIRNAMKAILNRVELSFKLEKELKETKEAKKEVQD